MRLAACLMLAALPAWVSAAALAPAAGAQTRAPSQAERSAFYAYYYHRFPDDHSASPVFSITRAGPHHAWRLSASITSQPQRGLRALCRMNRIDFSYDTSWQAGPAVQLVWLERTGCKALAHPVALAQRMPDTELLDLLGQRGPLLARARLLMAGNSECARQRSFNFSLIGIEVGTARVGTEEMAGLVFKSDRNSVAKVWVRRSQNELNAWSVSCP